MRNANTDYYHNFRFHVKVEGPGGIDYLDSESAGFNTCTLPELTTEATEYREGIWIYTRKYPGIPTVSDVSLGRGVTRKRSTFYRWMIYCIEGGEYRARMTIYQYHRVGKEPAERAVRDDLAYAKKYVCEECLPTRMKPAGDLDATSSDVSIQELDIAIERFKVVQPAKPYPSEWEPSTGWLSI